MARPPQRRAAGGRAPTPETAGEPGPTLLPRPSELLSPRAPWLVPLLLLVVTRIACMRLLPLATEDAYITFRYARNLVGAHQLVFNPGARVLGFSSPPWTLWCAAALALGQSPVLWTRVTSLLCDAVTLLVLGRALEREAGRASAWCFALFFAVWPFFPVVSASGMETSAMLMLVALGAALAARAASGAGVVTGLLALWRPEGPAAAAALLWRARWRDRVVALAILAIGIAALTLYYGSPVPQSVRAKAALYGTPGPWAGRSWWTWAVPVFLGAAGPPDNDAGLAFPLAIVLFPGMVAGVAHLWRTRRDGVVLRAVLACGAVWAGYALLGVAYFFWYLTLPLAAAALAAAVGLPRLVRGRIVWVALASYVATSWLPGRVIYLSRAQNEYFGFAGTAEWLSHNVHPGDTVMLEPIGLVGFRNPVVVIDEVGLVSPDVARRRLQGPGWYTDVVTEKRPDWLVVRRGVLANGESFAGAGAPFRSPAERDTLLATYESMTVIDEHAGDRALLILRRKP